MLVASVVVMGEIETTKKERRFFMTRHEPSTESVSPMNAGDFEVVTSAVSYLMQFPQSRYQSFPSEPLIAAVTPDSPEPRLPAAHMYSA